MGYGLVCHRCPDRKGAACGADGRPVHEHAKEAYCPRLRFAFRGLGDAAAWLLKRLGVDGVWRRLLADTAPCRWPLGAAVPGGGCGCERRRAAMNRAIPFSP